SGRHWRTIVKAVEGEEPVEVALVHGECSVEGTVWAEDGTPWPDVALQLSIASQDEEGGRKSTWRSWTRTDERGQYLLDGYESGHGWMMVGPSDDMALDMEDPDLLMSERFAFRPAEKRVINIGSPVGMASVHLTISDASGRRFRDGWVTLMSAGGGASSDPDLPNVRGDIAGDGTVSLRCAPGSYLVLVRGLDEMHGSIAEIDVLGPGDLSFDLSLKSGHSVHGTLVGSDGMPLKGMTDKLGVSLRREPSPRSRIVVSTPLRSDGTFSMHSVKPGDYYVTSGMKEAFSHVAVTLPEGDPIAVDVALQVAE
ncbi:MAG: carboxypeptidase-like regulatory domain-containing protein, partial [Planctomycetota bacterium]